MIKRILSIFLVLIIGMHMCIKHVEAASGKAYVLYNSNLSVGTTSTIKGIITTCGYTSYRYGDKTKSAIVTFMGNSKVFHILTHGSNGSFSASNGSVTITDIQAQYGTSSTALSNCKSMFFEACKVGQTSTFQNRLQQMGVNSSLAFTQNISANTSSDGCHYYAERFYVHAANAYTVTQCAIKACNDLVSAQGNSYGCAYSRIFGGSTTIN